MMCTVQLHAGANETPRAEGRKLEKLLSAHGLPLAVKDMAHLMQRECMAAGRCRGDRRLVACKQMVFITTTC